jgi:hypothetical protein
MNYFETFAVILLAGLIHASFQLSISMLTLLSGHAIGNKASQARVARLTGGFVGGAVLMTTLIVSFLVCTITTLLGRDISPLLWAVASGFSLGLAVAVWIFYYRRERGTALWIPRGFARYLSNRTKATKESAEAFGLGVSSVISELLFIIAPALIGALSIISLPRSLQLLGLMLYVVVSTFSLILVYVLVGSGHKLSRIQKWRETNKRFLQFIAGSALAVLGFYLYVNHVVVTAVVARGGM